MNAFMFLALAAAMQVPNKQTPPSPPPAPPVPVVAPANSDEQATVQSAWKDVEIAQLRLQIVVQSILAKHTGWSYNITRKQFEMPAPAPAEPAPAHPADTKVPNKVNKTKP